MFNATHKITSGMNTPKVSVIVPVYNVERYLRECLDTVINQTLKDIEIILIDDGSSDNSLSICREYEKRDTRIHVYTQQNQGAGATRNRGITLAKGEYLSFLDSDDFFELDMLEKLYNKCITTDSEICVCRSKCIVGNRVASLPNSLRMDYLWKDTFSLKDFFYSEHLYQIFVGWGWDKLFKKSLIEKHYIKFADLHHSEDLVFVFTALAIAEQITIIKDELVFHRFYSNSLSTNHGVRPADFMNAIFLHYNYLVKFGVFEKYRDSFISWIYNFSKFHYNSLYSASKRQIIIDCIREMAQKLPFDEKRFLRQLNGVSFFPKVSVIVPIYNVEKYLDRAMNSLINQTLNAIEIICVNDGSTDHSLDILRKYQSQDSRIKILNKKNTGYGHSMNMGVYMASGEYIAILEPDDFIKENMYEILYKKAKDFNLDFIKSDFYQIDGTENKSEISYKSCFEQNDYDRVINPQKDGIKPQQIATWTGLYKRSFLSQNKILHNETPGASYQDSVFFVKTLFFATRIMVVKNAFYISTKH